MRVLVTGAGGMLGRDLIAVLEKGHEVISLDLEGLDITDRKEHITPSSPSGRTS